MLVGTACCIQCGCVCPGDEVTISYFGSLSGPAKLRQHALKVAWGFVCSCPRCTAGENLPWGIQSAIQSLGREVDKDGDANPDRLLNQYRYAKSPAFMMSLSCDSAKRDAHLCAELGYVRSALCSADMFFGCICMKHHRKQDNCMLSIAS